MISEAAGACLGVDVAEAVGRPVARLGLRTIDAGMHPLNLQEVLSARYNRGGEARVVGVPGRRGGEDIRWLLVSTIEVADADATGSVSVALIVDSTGTSDAMEATNRTDQQFRKAIENAPLPMALVDLEWRLMEVNRAFAEMLGSTVSALRGTPFAALSHPADVSKERDELQRLYDGTQARVTIEKRFVKADGLVAYASLSVGMADNGGGPGSPGEKMYCVTEPAGPAVPIEKLSTETCDGPPPLPSLKPKNPGNRSASTPPLGNAARICANVQGAACVHTMLSGRVPGVPLPHQAFCVIGSHVCHVPGTMTAPSNAGSKTARPP